MAWTSANATAGAAPPNQISYFQNYGKFFTSFQKAMYGRAATAENDYCCDWLPRLDKVYDVLRVFDLMHQGKMTGYFCQGFNPLMAFPNKGQGAVGAVAAKFLVVMDPFATETATFWENHGEYNDSNPAEIQTEVFRLPTSCFAEESGSLGTVALESGRAAGRGAHRRRNSEQAVARGAGAIGRKADRSRSRSSICTGPTSPPRSRGPRRSPRRSTAMWSTMSPTRRI